MKACLWIAGTCFGVAVAGGAFFLGWVAATGGPPPGIPMHSDTIPWPIRLWLGLVVLGFVSMVAAGWADKRRGW